MAAQFLTLRVPSAQQRHPQLLPCPGNQHMSHAASCWPAPTSHLMAGCPPATASWMTWLGHLRTKCLHRCVPSALLSQLECDACMALLCPARAAQAGRMLGCAWAAALHAGLLEETASGALLPGAYARAHGLALVCAAHRRPRSIPNRSPQSRPQCSGLEHQLPFQRCPTAQVRIGAYERDDGSYEVSLL